MIILLAWTIPICLAMGIFGWLLDRQLDRGHEIRWHDRFYQPQLPVRRSRVIDVETRRVPWPGDQGTRSLSPEEDRRIVLASRVSRYPS